MARSTTPTGAGRLSQSLGGADPRARRNAAAAQNPEQQVGRGLRVSRRGKLEVQAGSRVAPHRVTVQEQATAVGDGDGSSLASLTASHDALVAEHRLLLQAHNALVLNHRSLSAKMAELLTALERAGFLDGGR